MYFENWGKRENPIRQSDLNSLFATKFGCAKRFAMSKIYPLKNQSKEMTLGSITHEIINNQITKNRLGHGNDFTVEEFKSKVGEQFDEYLEMLTRLFKTTQFKWVVENIVEKESAFYLKLDNYYLAGSVDVIVRGKNDSLIVIDWKTGEVPSQFEMDHGYQSLIYCMAAKEGEFFNKPSDMTRNEAYFESWEKDNIGRRSHNKNATMIYAYLRDLLPAKKASTREARHVSTKKISIDGNLTIKAGENHGPCFYNTCVDVETNRKRLLYSIRTATFMAEAQIFAENFGSHCESCVHLEKCRSLGVENNTKSAEQLMMELGIEPT